MTPTNEIDVVMAATAEVLHNIADAVADEDAAKLSPILHTAIPHLIKVPELYRTVQGKLSKPRANLLLHALQAIIVMLQTDTEAHSLSQIVDDDEEMHSEFLQALVDLIPSVCDLELQLIAVRFTSWSNGHQFCGQYLREELRRSYSADITHAGGNCSQCLRT